MSSSTTSTPAASTKTPRVLACVLCQHRKIKCDRNSPCSNCLKAGVTCTPSTPAPARKRRRPNQDLQQRLARCEELLKEYATGKPPSPTSESTPTGDSGTWLPPGQLVTNESAGTVRFIESVLWSDIHTELEAMKNILDDEYKDEDSSVCTPDMHSTPDDFSGLLLHDTSTIDIDELKPTPAHVFSLWQIFLDRVHPMVKVIHVPTVQPYLLQAARGDKDLPKNIGALLFAIYTIAVISLSEDECVLLLGCSKDEAFSRYSKGVRAILTKIGILRSYDMVVLQALSLYLFTLQGRYDRHGAWILNGVVVRIAHKMGLHRDGEYLGLSPFESEMRRRLWWHIILCDTLYALTSGLSHSFLSRSWDTKKPTNISDSDLFPAMQSVEPRNGPTDMIFCLMGTEFAKLLLDSPILHSVMMQNDACDLDGPSTSDLDKVTQLIDKVDRDIGEVLEKYADPSAGPIHVFTLACHPLQLDKLREFIRPPREQPEWGTEVFGAKDNIFKIAVVVAEQSIRMYSICPSQAFVWFMKIHFQIEVLLYMVAQLQHRKNGSLVERAWNVLPEIFEFHPELYNLSHKVHFGLATYVLRAWRKRERQLTERQGQYPETPQYILRLRSLIPMDEDEDMKEKELSESPSNPVAIDDNLQNNVDMVWDQMLGNFMVDGNTSSGWDMFSVGQGAAAPFVNLGTGHGDGNQGW